MIRHIIQGGKGIGFEQIDGVDWEGYARMNDIRILDGHGPQALDEVVIDETKARDNHFRVGDKIRPFGNHDYRIVGIYSPESGARVKMQKRINTELPGNTIQATRDVFTSFEKSIPYLGVFLRVLVGLAAVVSALVVMLAMYTTITERTREIGILKAMGASRGYIVGIIEKEAVLISVIGLVVGFVVSALAGYLIQKVYGLHFEYTWSWTITAAAIGLIGGIIGALYPALRASNLDAVNALSYD